MSMMPNSPYPAAKCGQYVEGGFASYPCTLPLEHTGPCYAVEVDRSRRKREAWEQEHPEEVEAAKERLEAQRRGEQPAGASASAFVEDQPDPVVTANDISSNAAPQPTKPDTAAGMHAMVALEEIVDVLRDVYGDEASDDPVAAVQRLAAEREGLAAKVASDARS